MSESNYSTNDAAQAFAEAAEKMRALGELRAASNLITACVSCNSEKQDLTVRQYAAFRRGKYGESQAGLIPRIVAAIGHRSF